MAKFSADIKAYIIQRVAAFDYPSVVVDAVLEDFKVKITRQDVERHDPTKVSGKDLAKRWISLFNESRRKFLDDTSNIAISHKAVRMRMLQRMAAKAEDMKNFVLAASLLEQAAKEMGEAYTNRQKVDLDHKSTDGSMTPKASAPAMTPEQVTAAAAEAVKALIG